jgi:hypothetical protein
VARAARHQGVEQDHAAGDGERELRPAVGGGEAEDVVAVDQRDHGAGQQRQPDDRRHQLRQVVLGGAEQQQRARGDREERRPAVDLDPQEARPLRRPVRELVRERREVVVLQQRREPEGHEHRACDQRWTLRE